MKISRRDQKIILVVLGVLLAFLSYFFGFRNFSEKNSTLKSENNKLAEQVQQLELLDARREQYLVDAAEFNRQIDEILEEYPAEVREENVLMFAYDLEAGADVHVSALTISPKNLLYTMGPYSLADSSAEDGGAEGNAAADTAADTGTAASGEVRNLSVVVAELEYTITYDGFKNIVGKIQADEDKRNVESISLSYDSDTGNLIGTMVVNLFQVDGGTKEYKAPYIPSMQKGNSNPFGSIEVWSNDSETPESPETPEEEE